MLLPPGEPFRELVGGSAPGGENRPKQRRIENIRGGRGLVAGVSWLAHEFRVSSSKHRRETTILAICATRNELGHDSRATSQAGERRSCRAHCSPSGKLAIIRPANGHSFATFVVQSVFLAMFDSMLMTQMQYLAQSASPTGNARDHAKCKV